MPMLAINAAESGSTGSFETSRFHSSPAGKIRFPPRLRLLTDSSAFESADVRGTLNTTSIIPAINAIIGSANAPPRRIAAKRQLEASLMGLRIQSVASEDARRV